MKLRPYQRKGVRDIFAAWKKHRRVLYSLVTAGGKTVVAARVIQISLRSGKRVLALAHRRELILQMADKLIADGVPAEDVGVIMAGHEPKPDARVQVASIDTLRNRTAPKADVIVIDEAHRTGANTYQTILSWYPKAKVLGITATPKREDGKALGDSFDVLVHGPKPSAMVKGGFILSPRVFTKIDRGSVDLRGVGRAKGDFIASQLSKRINTKQQRGDIVEHVIKRAGKRATVVFACDVKHAKDLLKAFKRAGVNAGLLLGETDKTERERLLHPVTGDIVTGKVQVLVTVMVVSEGWDLPIVKCAVLARPTESLVLFLQQAGRILRPYKNVTPIILDHYGNILRPGFGFPDQDRPWSLDGDEKSIGSGAAPVKECQNPECEAVVPAGAAECPECGYSFERARKKLEKEQADLVELKKRDYEAAMSNKIARIYEETKKLGKPRILADVLVNMVRSA